MLNSEESNEESVISISLTQQIFERNNKINTSKSDKGVKGVTKGDLGCIIIAHSFQKKSERQVDN
jgi:hypothetical protein